jgi:L-2-hydroxycarboxylate dehydrogenase (NAD+)
MTEKREWAFPFVDLSSRTGCDGTIGHGIARLPFKSGNTVRRDNPRAKDSWFPSTARKAMGSGLMFGLLAGTLNGAAFGRDVVDYTVDSKTPSNTGHAIMSVDIGAFTDVQDFKRDVDEVGDVMKSSPTLPGVDEVRPPGEPSETLYRQRMAHGVPLGAQLRKALDDLADRLGIQRLQ